MNGERDKLLDEVKGLLVTLTDEDCKILLAAIKIGLAHLELSPEECVEMARREAAT